MGPLEVHSWPPPNMHRERFMAMQCITSNSEKVILGLTLKTCEMVFLRSLQLGVV